MSRSRGSSPDPLSRSTNDESVIMGSSPIKSPVKRDLNVTPKASRIANPKNTPGDLSPNKQQRTIIFNTPSKQGGAQSVSQQSPWRIKVTLETEPENAQTPKSGRKPKATTMKIPLKGEDKPRPAKRRRTSDQVLIEEATPAASAGLRRRPTPARQRTPAARATRQSIAAADKSITAGVGGEIEVAEEQHESATQSTGRSQKCAQTPPKKRGRPRKSMPGTGGKNQSAKRHGIVSEAEEDPEESVIVLTPNRKKGHQDPSIAPLGFRSPSHARGAATLVGSFHGRTPNQGTTRPSMSTERTQSVHTAEETTYKVTNARPSSKELLAEESLQEQPGRKSIRGTVPTPRRPVERDESGVSSLPPSSPQKPHKQFGVAKSSDTLHLQDVNEDISASEEEAEVRADEDGETAVLDRSLAESEGFTMVSIESLRSQKGQAPEAAVPNPASGVNKGPDIVEGFRIHERTPSPMSPGKTPFSAKTLSASDSKRASQEKPTRRDQSVKIPPNDEPKQQAGPIEIRGNTQNSEGDGMTAPGTDATNHDSGLGLFDAFRTGTKRRLRAGLAMGELLARSEPAFPAPRHVEDDAHSKSAIGVERREHSDHDIIDRLPTPPDTVDESSSPTVEGQEHQGREDCYAEASTGGEKQYDDMSWEPTTFVEARAASLKTYDDMSWEPSANLRARDALVKPYDEMSWEPTDGHHAATSRAADRDQQATQATGTVVDKSMSQQDSSRVSTNSSRTRPRRRGGQPAGGDMWLEEADSVVEDSMADQAGRAKSLRVSARDQQSVGLTQNEAQEDTPDLREILGEPDTRPTRGKIPRTWRRTSGHHFLYSDENPSPEQKKAASPKPAPGTPLFLRDLRALDEEDEGEDEDQEADQDRHRHDATEQEDDEVKESIDRSDERQLSPLKSILSSPLRIRDSRSPKEVRFGWDAIQEYQEHPNNDEEYYSSDSAKSGDEDDADSTTSSQSESYGDADRTMYDIDTSFTTNQDTSIDAQTSDVRQLHRELKAASPQKQIRKRTASAASLDAHDQQPSSSSVLLTDPKKHYPTLLGTKTSAQQPLPAYTPRRKPLPPTPRRSPPPVKNNPTKGIFSRLSTWLYPEEPSVLASTPAFAPFQPNAVVSAPAQPPLRQPAPISAAKAVATTQINQQIQPLLPGWNRNNYLLLESHWKAAFPTPCSVLSAAITLYGTRDPDNSGIPLTHASSPYHPHQRNPSEEDEIAALSEELQNWVGRYIRTKGEYAMQVTPAQCAVASAFMAEAAGRGIPILTCGELDPSSSSTTNESSQEVTGLLEGRATGRSHGQHRGNRDDVGWEVGYPRRDTDGRVRRMKEEWSAYDTLIRIYGLWVRDVEAALGERRQRSRKSEGQEEVMVKWPEINGCKTG